MQSCHVLPTTPASDPCCLFSTSPQKHYFQPGFILVLKTQLPKFRHLSVKASATTASEKKCLMDTNDEKQSFYELLGISQDGSLDDIKQAYREMARKYHPDVSPPGRVEEYTQWFIRVNEAYETLSDPQRRALYDRDLGKGLHFAFSARKIWQSHEGLDERSEWKNHWQSQVSELKRKSMNRDARGNMSWGARMRRQRNGS